MKLIRRVLISLGILNFKIGDKVEPNYRIFKSSYIFPNGRYSTVRKIKGDYIHIKGFSTPFQKKELKLFTKRRWR